ncbi:MAG: SGNH/GDSL hydrolase family protein [Cyanobacteria bacterium P01_G01_bin.54]
MWVVLVLTGERAKLASYKGQPADVYAYQLQMLSPNGKSVSGRSTGQLNVQPDWSMGYRLKDEQNSNYWAINPQGFRAPEPLPREKPPGEVRIFLLGSSATFGQGLKADEQTIARRLEQRLQARLAQQKQSPEKYKPTTLPNTAAGLQAIQSLPRQLKSGTYHVINAAVPGYASGNQLAQVALEILPYQPDVIVVMNGYDDLMLASDQEMAILEPITQRIEKPLQSAWQSVTRPFLEFIRNTRTFKAIQFYLLKPQPSLPQQALPLASANADWLDYLPEDGADLDERVQRYRQNMKQLIQLCAGARVPLIVSLQPEITGIDVDNYTSTEAAIASTLPENYQTLIPEGYAQLELSNNELEKAFPNNVKILNYYPLFNDLSAAAFTDPVNLTDDGTKALSERFYNAIAELPQLQVIPSQPQPQ